MTTDQVIKQFNDAFQTRSPELLPDLIAENCVMEGIGPAPDGERTEGYDACLPEDGNIVEALGYAKRP